MLCAIGEPCDVATSVDETARDNRFSKSVSEHLAENLIYVTILIRCKRRFLITLFRANNTKEPSIYTHVPMLVMTPGPA